jgi:ferredoxin
MRRLASSFFAVPALLQSRLSSLRRHADHLTGDRTKPLTTTWVLPNGEEKRNVVCYDGQTLLEIATEQDFPVEGACGGVCACSTCHMYIDDTFEATFDSPSEKEDDMIDQAFHPKPNSRLGCQLKVVRGVHDGMRVSLPKATRNMAVDGYVAKPH